ncbi:MAG TPA: hypothetical protein VLI41_02305 [Phenylobacterium sp.]|uniref:hypothetical protein n=1 Tax=Phenylobacterium sp. TaxID=1871053 RepID=UPI002C51AC31|nr:hypothetical protein [Phenylobacterium sp.]HSV02012.1 hypothetical protein [Phenylobacterium sp.]
MEVTRWVGFLIILAGAGLTFHLMARRLRAMRNRAPGTPLRRLESSAEIASQAVLFGGGTLMNFASFAENVSAGTLPNHLWLTLYGNAAMLVLLGLHLGRLFMRWQLKHLGGVLDTASGAFMARA